MQGMYIFRTCIPKIPTSIRSTKKTSPNLCTTSQHLPPRRRYRAAVGTLLTPGLTIAWDCTPRQASLKRSAKICSPSP